MVRVANHYESALADSGIAGPSSWVSVALHPNREPLAETVRVLVHCDRPDVQEIVTAEMPQDWASAATPAASLLADVLDAGLVRLGVARGWDSDRLTRALGSARMAVKEEFGANSSLYRVVAEGRGASAPEQPHEILVVGGGPENGVPKAYLDELSRLLDIVAGDSWAEWWSHSPIKLAEVFFWFNGARLGVRVRVGAVVRASIERPVATMKDTSPESLARDDVATLVARLTARLDLPQSPELR